MDPTEEQLFRLLGLVNDWLTFGETQNGGIAVLAGVAAMALLTYDSDIEDPTP